MIKKAYTRKQLVNDLFTAKAKEWRKEAENYQKKLEKKTDKYLLDAALDCTHIADEIEFLRDEIISELR